MIELLVKTFGWLAAHSPEWGLRLLSRILGRLIFHVVPKRQSAILSNLDHAFPDRPMAWKRQIGRESCNRLAETLLHSLATPFFSETRLRATVSLSPRTFAWFEANRSTPKATLFATLHLAYWEAQTCQALFVPPPFPEYGVIFRPLNNASLNDWVKRTRERFGMTLLSRKEGFQDAIRILRRKGAVGILIDQNAGTHGALTTLLGRLCSTSELVGLLAEKNKADVRILYPKRLDFWRVEIDVAEIPHDGTTAGITIALNQWLEHALANDENLCASWLWAHGRWRNQHEPERRLRLEAKRDFLAADLKAHGLTVPERRTRYWIRLPNWLGDVVMAMPLIRAIREGRPDAEITLIGKAQFKPLVEMSGLADHYEPLPKQGVTYFCKFRELRHRYPDCYLLFTNSTRGDIEARITGCRQRFGILRPGKRRPLLSHSYKVPADFDESANHQFVLWENFLRNFGLTATIDLSPLKPTSAASPAPASAPIIGLICGSENQPSKRWPVAHWRSLITALSAEIPGVRFVLFGTPGDAAITGEIARGFESITENLAGRTDLPGFAARLRDCTLLVTNDTGGMHLANALGVPLIALFGPTNPIRTKPVFSAPFSILQPPGCPAYGGGNLADLTPATVTSAVRDQLAAMQTS